MSEWSKEVDSSSIGVSRAGSNPAICKAQVPERSKGEDLRKVPKFFGIMISSGVDSPRGFEPRPVQSHFLIFDGITSINNLFSPALKYEPK